VFALFDISINGIIVEPFGRLERIGLEIGLYVRSKLDSCSDVDGDIDVGVFVQEEFVADPASCEPDYERLCLLGFTRPCCSSGDEEIS
jgi:hypothetical protein